MPRSDVIIYLDYPTYLTIWRTIRRRIVFRNKLRPEMPTGWKENLDFKFFTYALNYNRKERHELLSLLHKYEDKLVILHSPKETKAYSIRIQEMMQALAEEKHTLGVPSV